MIKEHRAEVLCARFILLFIFLACVSCQKMDEEQNAREANTSDTGLSHISETDKSSFEKGRQALFNAKTRFEYPNAINLLEQAVEKDAGNAQAALFLVYAYTKRGRYDDAHKYIPTLSSLSDRLDKKDRLWLNALTARVEDNNPLEIGQWQQVVTSFPSDRWAWYELAAAYSSSEQYLQAAEAAAQANVLEPDPAKWEASWLYYLYSKALFRSGQYEKAARVVAPVASESTTWRSTYFRMVLAKVASGKVTDTDGIVEEYRQISAGEGRNNESYTEANLALFFFELGDFIKASTHAKAAYDMEPKAYQAWSLGYSLTENGNAAEGLAIVEKAIEDFPNNPRVLASKGWALYRLGRLEEAREALIAAQKLSARQNFQIDQQLNVVTAAINNPDSPPAPPIPWLG